VHVDKLVKGYHRHHPLDSPKNKAGQGTKNLICALQTLSSTPSPTQKVVAWLLNNTRATTLLHIPVASISENKQSPVLMTHPSPQQPFRLFRRHSPEPVLERCEPSCKDLYNSCRNTNNEVGPPPVNRSPWELLEHALVKTVCQASSPRMSPCATLPSSGHGRPL